MTVLTPIPSRSEPAREKRPATAHIQAARVIVNVHRQQAGSYRGLVYKSGMSVRNKEGQRGPPKSQVGFKAASRGVDLAFDFDLLAPWGGRVEVLRSGQPGMDAGLAAPGPGWPMAAGPRSRTGARVCRAMARHRTKGARALGYLGLFQVTRRKGETISSRYRTNGYVLIRNQSRKCPTIPFNSTPNCANSILEAAFPCIANED